MAFYFRGAKDNKQLFRAKLLGDSWYLLKHGTGHKGDRRNFDIKTDDKYK